VGKRDESKEKSKERQKDSTLHLTKSQIKGYNRVYILSPNNINWLFILTTQLRKVGEGLIIIESCKKLCNI